MQESVFTGIPVKGLLSKRKKAFVNCIEGSRSLLDSPLKMLQEFQAAKYLERLSLLDGLFTLYEPNEHDDLTIQLAAIGLGCEFVHDAGLSQPNYFKLIPGYVKWSPFFGPRG